MNSTGPSRWLASIFVLAVACSGGSSGGSGEPDDSSVAGYVAAVSCDGCAVQRREGAPPSETSALRVGTAFPNANDALTFLPGGTTSFDFDAAGYTRIIVAVAGVEGYYEVAIPTGATSLSVLVTFAQQAEDFVLRLGAGDATTLLYEDVPISLVAVGTGDVQVNVTWDLDVDVDLHVLDPSGEEVFYGNPYSTSGGVLDLDSNAACSLDHVRAENVTWETGTAPSGTYRVLLDYWEACVPGTVHYVVTVNVKGKAPQTFSGQFAASDADYGGECFAGSGTELYCGRHIATFTR